ncbi:MAG: hypothetical protein HY924_09220 [Elusimicrobia bacterium]|nr:hypothetical protein [Elusimicrobiota bacterium]
MMLVATLLVSLTCSAHAAVVPALPGFEAALTGLRANILAAKAERIEAKNLQAAYDLDRLASDVRGFQWTAQRLKSDLQDLRRRAQRIQPGQPNNDPFFRNDLNRAVWALRDLQWAVQRVRMDAERLAMQARPDPGQIQSARRFTDSFTWTESEIGWLASEARWAEWDIRRAGFSMEAWDISRYSADVERDIRDSHREADEILRKVSAPVPAPQQP